MTQPKDFETRALEAANKYSASICTNWRESHGPLADRAAGAWNGFHEGVSFFKTHALELEAELTAARAELEKQKKRFSMDDGRFYNAEAVDSALIELDELRAELARAREALEFYANRGNWYTGVKDGPDFKFRKIDESDLEKNRTGGRRARAALSGTEPKSREE